ncbi:hypothetical protein MAR_009580 [Mya arenaria]|uniref:Uncharacterized protein n=1 Tax=Mya arenaria TaxID=6604 RepID=A0ABY7DZ57_MYAAR|nr:hypothetical protein MAR_009580 [Mya arenaria]
MRSKKHQKRKMDVKEHRFIYTLLLISMLHEVELLPEGNVSTIFPNTTNAPVRCQIFSKDEKVVADIKDAISSGTKLIKYHLKLDNSDHKWEGKNKSDAYKLLYWVRTTGRHGTGLLLLRHDYDILSLTTLELGVVTLDVRIQEHPVDCLQNTSLTDVETLLRELVMNDFQNKSITEAVEMAASENVCNLHVLNDSGTARYKYICCSRGANAYLTCHYLESDIWLTILMVSVTVLKILIALYSPRFVPQSLYRLRNFAKPFVHKIDPRELKVIRTRTPDLYKSQEANAKQITTISSKKLKHMPKFEDALSSLRPEAPYTLIIDKLLLRVKSDRLLPEDYAPVSLIKALYESFVRCEIRYRSSAEDCCKADVCSAVACTKKSCSWYRSVTLYLTPIHVLFLAIYCLLIFESLTYGIIRKRAKERLQFVMRKCFSDMADGEKIFGTVTQTYLKFNETMHSVVAGLLKEEIEEEVRKSEEKQENLAFKMPLQDFTSNEAYEGQDNTVENKTSPKGVLSIEVEDGIPQWTTSHLLLFLTRKDQPMIPSRFFFDSCKMPYYNVPGDILLKYLYAFVEFGSIIIFLLFVLLVVLAFDDAYNVTATNKLLATVAGGFLPFMLKKFLIKAHSITEVDISDIHFKICLNEVVKSYKESWPIFDIELKSCEEFKPTAILVDNEVLTTERSEIVDLMIDISEETKKSERHESNYIDMY